MPRDRTDVVRRSLFGAGTPPSGNQDGEPGERRTNAKPNRNTASRGAERSQNRSAIRETAAVSPPPVTIPLYRYGTLLMAPASILIRSMLHGQLPSHGRPTEHVSPLQVTIKRYRSGRQHSDPHFDDHCLLAGS